jgi:hypothetical protein
MNSCTIWRGKFAFHHSILQPDPGYYFVYFFVTEITVNLPVVLYGREAWSLTLREEHGLRVFENRVLRKTFGPKSEEVTWEWKKLHKEELYALYSSPNIIRMIK